DFARPGPNGVGRLRDLGRRGAGPQRAKASFDLARPAARVSRLRLRRGPIMERRDFLRFGLATLGGAAAPPLMGFDPVSVAHPVGDYPNRGWEQVYRDQYRVDGWFSWVCAPNDTHNCLLRAYVRNGVVLRSESGYECGRVKDLYGHSASDHWNPRSCSKGESQ